MKSIRIISLLLILSTNMGAVLASKEEKILSLDQVLNLAYENNLGLKIANKNIDINNAEVITAGMLPNPELFTVAGVAQRTYNPGIQQMFPLGRKIKRRKEVAEAKYAVIDKSIQQTALDLRFKVKNLFYEILTLEEKQKIFQELLEITDKTLKTAKRRFELQEITILDLNQIELLTIDIRKESIAVNIEIKKLRNELSQILNFNLSASELAAYEDEASELTELINTKTQDELVELAMKNRPDFSVNEAMLKLNAQELKLAKAIVYPDLTLGLGPDIVTGEGGGFNFYAQMQLGLPVFDRQQGEIQKTKERAEQINLEKEETVLLIEKEVKNTINNYEIAKAQLELYQKEVLDKSKEFIVKAEKSYGLGKTIVLTFLEAVKTSQSIYLGYLDTKLSYQKATVDAERVLAL